MTRVQICDDVGLVVFELSPKIFDTLGRIRASIAIDFATKAGRHKQGWDLLVQLRHLGDGL